MVLESNTLDLLFVKDGEQGTDGKMLYTWIKYAKDDKGTDMTDDPQSAVYIGISYNNESNVESDDPTQYAWTKIQGADGKKGEDAYTIVLENENISFATDENRNPLSEQAYTSRITVMKGATPVTDFGIGDIAKTQGIAIAKGDDGISISVVNGNALPADSGEITVPISVGGTVFKKVLTWTCAKKGEQGVKGDKGDTGQKGQDGTSVKITSKSVTYQTSTSGTTAPTGTWSTTVPTVNNGQYLWTKTTVQYSDGNKTEAYSVSYKGTNGTNGTSVTVSKTEITYQVSTSGTTAPTGTWSTTMPSCDQGQYLWTKTYVKYSDGKDTTSYSVSYKGVDGEKFAFNMLRETNQGSKHWVNMGASGKYSVESITTEDSINAVKLICTKPIASNEWQFCEFSDYEMLKSLKASTAYTLSYDIKTNRSGKISHNIKTGGGQKPFFANDISCKVLGNETWEHVSLKMTSGTTLPNLDRQVIYMFNNALSKVGYSIIKNLKLTEGIVDTPWAPHPEDLEGRGVSETVQYYLATSQASGVTSSTSGWSTDITTQKLTADKKYLWNCYQTKYSDGTSEPISTPKVIGVYGDKGNGIVASVQRPNKTEFWWSQVGAVGHKDTFDDSSNTRNNCRVGDIFTVMGTSTEGNSHTVYYKSATDSGDLAGECINHVIAESGTDAKNLSITPSSQYFKSTDGGKTFAPNTITIKPTIQGEINFGKWQYSIDGGVSFADVVSGQKGLTISNNVLTVSKDSGLYSDAVTMVTFRAVASDSSFYDTCSIAKIYDVSDIGDGRNLWITRDNITLQACEKDKYIYTTTGTSAVCIGADVSSVGTNTIALQTGTKYTISFVISSPSEVSNARWFFCTALNNTGVKNYGGYGVKLVTGENIVSQTITVDTSCDAAGLIIYNLPTDCIIKDIQVEKGSSPTGWTPAPEDIQTAILSTKNSIDSVSSKVDTNTKSIQDKVSKTTYERELTLVKGDLSKANEGLNKWRYEIYPKSLFDSEDQSKSTIDIFARNLNLVPSQTVLLDDASLSTKMYYGDRHIAYALTFVKMGTKKDITTKMFNDDGASLYVNGGLISSRGGDLVGTDVTFTLMQGWNCLEVVVNEQTAGEGFRFSTTLSKLSECQMMNCYYGTPIARQSRITNQLVDVTKNLTGVTSTVQDVMTAVGNSGNITEFKNNYSKWKQSVDKIEQRVGETYVTNDKFDNLQIGGRNLIRNSNFTYGTKYITSESGAINIIDSAIYGKALTVTPVVGKRIFWETKNVWNNSTYTVSFVAKSSVAGQKIRPSRSVADWGEDLTLTTEYKRYITQIKTTVTVDGGTLSFSFSNAVGAITLTDVKLEKGNKATDYTPAPEDVNGKIQSVETIATQTADKFNWLVKSGTSSSNFELTDRTATLVAENINLNGLVTFSGLDSSARDRINTVTSGNLITVTPANPKSDYDGGQTYNVIADDKGGRCVQWNSSCASFLLLNSYTPVNFTSSDQLYYDIHVPNWSSTTFDTNLTIWFYNKNKTLVTSATKTLTLKSTMWNHFTGYLTLPSSSNWGDLYYYIIGLTNPNKQAIGITNDSYIERVNSYATTYAKNAVDWVGQNGTNTNNMYSMVSKWTDGAVSDTTQMNGGWIKTNTITANKIAIGDFTNYADINESNTYWFLVEQTKEGTWFYRDGSALQRDNVISEFHTCRGGETFYVEYDISNTIKEGDEYKYAGLMIFGYDGNGGIVSYNRNAGVTATANGEITHITTQLTMPDTTRSFRVYLQIEGHTPFTGTLKIRNISVRKAVTGNLIVDGAITADKIATDAIKSRNYISSGGAQGSFLNLSDGSFTSPNLSWDSNGNLIAKNANLSGEITATNGSIAGWTIISNKMYTTGSGKYTGIGKYGSAYAFWAGATSNDNGNSAVFKVGHTGKLTATDADITGTITATNGKIGRYDITSTYLMTNSGSNASGIGGNQAFWAGAEDSNSAPFRVGYDGVLWAENAAIRGSIETGNLGDEGDTVSIINGHIGIQGTSNNVEIYSTGFKFGIDGDYYLMSVSEGVKCYRNLYATDFVADGWLYCSEVHSSGAVVIGADSESFYWAHGYQIARGTSWGGVCVGDDSQQLRLYGSSIWASHSISTSDENLKENFTTLDQYENFYMNLNPIGFNYIGDYDGKKTHFGFGAHKTEDVLESEGYDADKFAVVTHRPLVQEDIEKRFGKDVEVDIETEYGVSYTEFIALNTHMIQKTRRELTKVKQEKADLEVRLQAIEAKLGL